jgi:D-3-phosphoglycerate dehydrogenase
MKPRWTVVVTDAETSDLPIERTAVERIGGKLVVGRCQTEQDVIALARDADAVLYDYAPITANVIGALDKCRVIVRYGVGLDRIDLAAAEARGIEVRYLPGWSSDEVSDHTLALIFAVGRRLLPLDRWVRRGNWGYSGERNPWKISGKHLGLVGFGAIARCVARKARGIGIEVIAYDPYVLPDVFVANGVTSVSLEELLREVDIVSLHVPHRASTVRMIGEAQFAMMKNGAMLINTARGGVVDEPALINALQSGKLSGAGLDVFAGEPPAADSPLLSMDCVVLTPHMACYSETSMDEMHERAIDHVIDVLTRTET